MLCPWYLPQPLAASSLKLRSWPYSKDLRRRQSCHGTMPFWASGSPDDPGLPLESFFPFLEGHYMFGAREAPKPIESQQSKHHSLPHHIYLYIHIYTMYKCICLYIDIFLYIQLCIYTHLYICYICLISICICIIYICMCICIKIPSYHYL